MKHPDEALRFIKMTVRKHLPDPSYRFFLFGSRVSGGAHPYSDFDIGILGKKPVPGTILNDIQETFENSSLPVRVDVVDMAQASASFHDLAIQEIQYL